MSEATSQLLEHDLVVHETQSQHQQSESTLGKQPRANTYENCQFVDSNHENIYLYSQSYLRAFIALGANTMHI